jgi:hypothetical protein
MPFDYEDYQKKINTLTTEQLHKEWENYTRQIAGGATSTATSVLFSPLTAGISLIGLGLSGPRIHNARKKREIIEAGLQARGTTHQTRKRDVIAPMAVAGTLGGLTLGLAGPGADMIAGEVVGHGVEYAVSHAALDATGAVIEHTHDEHSKKKAEHKLQAQYQRFQQQYVQEQANINGVQGQMPVVGAQPGYHNLQPGMPQYQPQTPGQEPTYEPVPVPVAHGQPVSYIPPPQPQPMIQPVSQPQIAFQPASHQQQLPQGMAPPPLNFQAFQTASQEPQPQTNYLPTPAPQYQQPIQQPEKVLITVPGLTAQAGPIDSSYFPEKSAAYAASIPQLGQDLPVDTSVSQSPTPAPAYSALDGQTPPSDTKKESAPAEMTMEEEIALLKARLLMMELEKRGESLEAPNVTIVEPQPQHIQQNVAAQMQEPVVVAINVPASQPQVTISPVLDGQQQQQSYPPPPSHPPRSPSIPTSQYAPPPLTTPTAQLSNYPPPPPSPYQHQPQPSPNTYQPQNNFAPPSPNTYQPQNFPTPSPNTYNPQTYAQSQPGTYNPQQAYPQPPKSPNPQQQYQRHDSGYYSAAPTPQPVSQQSTGNQHLQHGRNPSQVSLSPMSPPPPYFPPPPGGPNLGAGGNDYFAQGQAPPQQHYQQGYQPAPTPGYQGTQCWQWGTPAPPQQVGRQAGQPNYGPSPPIPTAWRSQ